MLFLMRNANNFLGRILTGSKKTLAGVLLLLAVIGVVLDKMATFYSKGR
jgi:hypothetical protein